MLKKILIIDDSPIARKILRSCMPGGSIFEFSEAGDGQAGLQRFQEMQPDLTFTDLTMPVMNGMEALERMKRVRPEALIVVCSADVQPKTIERVMKLGAFAMLRKPPSKEALSDLFSRVDSLLGGGESN